uniref:Uncharacterized protein n=1 Tax=Romanomermis culicivorax TaxID=13658 RepID=A0A915JZY7_ROMCU
MEMHGDSTTTTVTKAEGDESGTKIERPEGYEPPVQATV